MTYNINSAIRQGHGHIFEEKPCQDSLFTYQDSFIHSDDCFTLAIVSDGCSSGNKSEVGANLLSYLCGNYILSYLQQNPDRDIKTMLDNIFQDLVLYVKNSLPIGFPELQFIGDYWLATILGVIIYRNKCYKFSCGDGIYCIDDKYTVIDQNNYPKYLAYAAISDPIGYNIDLNCIPYSFNFEEFEEFNKVMISTDGFENHKNSNLETLREKQWDKTKAQFTKWARLCSNQGYFYDDCAIIAIERKEQ